MCEKRFTNVSMGREEAYCDFSIIKVGDKIISEIPTTDAIRICDLLNEQQERINELENINEDLSKFIDYAGLRAEFFKYLFSIKEVRVGE